MQEKINWMVSKGFSSGGDIYCVGCGNTYLIKDTLKELGFRYSAMFGWYSDTVLPVPAPYQLIHFTFDELYMWDSRYHKAFLYEESPEKIKNALQITKNTSHFIGAVGDKIIELPIVLYKTIYYNKNKKLYIFKNNENKLVWRTDKTLAAVAGGEYLLSGIIAAHETYRNEQTTRLIRCVLKNPQDKSFVYFL